MMTKTTITVTFDLDVDQAFPPAPDGAEIATYLALIIQPRPGRDSDRWELSNPTVCMPGDKGASA